MPQWAPLVWRLTHTPPQSDWPIGHAHMPALQVVPPEHETPHAPQLALSVCALVHTPPQRICCVAHITPRSGTPPASPVDEGQFSQAPKPDPLALQVCTPLAPPEHAHVAVVPGTHAGLIPESGSGET